MENRPVFICTIRPTRPGFVDQMLPEEEAAMQAHAAYYKQLVSENKIILYGPCLDRALGIAVFEAASLEDACQLMTRDPAVERGVMAPEIHPFHIAFLRQSKL